MDNLQPDFLYDHIQPVRAELFQVCQQNWFLSILSCCLKHAIIFVELKSQERCLMRFRHLHVQCNYAA